MVVAADGLGAAFGESCEDWEEAAPAATEGAGIAVLTRGVRRRCRSLGGTCPRAPCVLCAALLGAALVAGGVGGGPQSSATSPARDDSAAASEAWDAGWPCVVLSTQRIGVEESCQDLPSGTASETFDVAVIPGEWEHRQVLLPPTLENTSASVVFGPLAGPGGSSIAATAFSLRAVGYVFLENTTRYHPSGGGWTADPLLPPSDDGSVPLAADTASPLWVTLKVPASALAGSYWGYLSVIWGGEDGAEQQWEVPVTVRVWACPPLEAHETLRSFGEIWSTKIFAPEEGVPETPPTAEYGGAEAVRFGFGPEDGLDHFYPDGFTEELQLEFLEAMADRLLPPDPIYTQMPLDIKNYTWLAERAGAALLHLGDIANWHGALNGKEGLCSENYSSTYIQEVLDALRPTVEALEAAGLPQRGAKPYVYGFDEVPRECEQHIRDLYGAVKRAFPGVLTVATLNWEEMPIDLPVDVWVVLYQLYNASQAFPWQSTGKKVFMYHCIGPANSLAMNTFIEKPWVHARMLYWYAALLGADGWLYYSTDNWRPHPNTTHKVMERLDPSSPLTDFPPADYVWSPRADIFANGDGQFFYPGPDGFISTARLEHIRMAIQDQRLFALARAVGVVELDTLLKHLVRGELDHTDDPVLLEFVRRQVADRTCSHVREGSLVY